MCETLGSIPSITPPTHTHTIKGKTLFEGSSCIGRFRTFYPTLNIFKLQEFGEENVTSKNKPLCPSSILPHLKQIIKNRKNFLTFPGNRSKDTLARPYVETYTKINHHRKKMMLLLTVSPGLHCLMKALVPHQTDSTSMYML